MLYGSLLQAMPYLKNDARLPLWKSEYDEIVRVLKGEDLTRIGDRQATVLDS
jgi:Mg2+/Co2+ transporter CorB